MAIVRRVANALVVTATVLPILWAMEVLARWSDDAPLVAAVAGVRIAATVAALSLLLVRAYPEPPSPPLREARGNNRSRCAARFPLSG